MNGKKYSFLVPTSSSDSDLVPTLLGSGINVVRERIKTFAQKKVTLPLGRHKLIILDEADSMTTGAQQALRRTMELYANTTRFAFACNASNKIIEPIQSRCAILRYARLSDKELLKRLMEICELEKVTNLLLVIACSPYQPSRADMAFREFLFFKVPHNSDGLTALIFTSEGDMRQAVNNLQSTYSGFGYVGPSEVFKVCDQPHPLKVQQLIKDCIKSDVDQAMLKLEDLWNYGYSAVDIVTTLFRVVKGMEGMQEKLKLEFIRVRFCPSSSFSVAALTDKLAPFVGDRVHSHEDPRRSLDGRSTRRTHRSTMSNLDGPSSLQSTSLDAVSFLALPLHHEASPRLQFPLPSSPSLCTISTKHSCRFPENRQLRTKRFSEWVERIYRVRCERTEQAVRHGQEPEHVIRSFHCETLTEGQAVEYSTTEDSESFNKVQRVENSGGVESKGNTSTREARGGKEA